MEKVKEFLEKVKWSHVLAFLVLYTLYGAYTQDRAEIESEEGHVTQLRAQIETTKRKITDAKEFEKQIEVKKAALAELDTQLRSKKAELPKTFNVPELLSDIFAEAQQVGLEVDNVVPDQGEAKAELYASMKIEVKARGTFLQLFIFLDRLSKLKRLVGVNSVGLNVAGPGDRVTLKGTTVALSGKRLTGGDKTFRQVNGSISLLAYRILEN